MTSESMHATMIQWTEMDVIISRTPEQMFLWENTSYNSLKRVILIIKPPAIKMQMSLVMETMMFTICGGLIQPI